MEISLFCPLAILAVTLLSANDCAAQLRGTKLNEAKNNNDSASGADQEDRILLQWRPKAPRDPCKRNPEGLACRKSKEGNRQLFENDKGIINEAGDVIDSTIKEDQETLDNEHRGLSPRNPLQRPQRPKFCDRHPNAERCLTRHLEAEDNNNMIDSTTKQQDTRDDEHRDLAMMNPLQKHQRYCKMYPNARQCRHNRHLEAEDSNSNTSNTDEETMDDEHRDLKKTLRLARFCQKNPNSPRCK